MTIKDGIKLSTARINANMNLQTVSEKTGFSVPKLSNWENGLKINKEDFKKLCKLYKVDEKDVNANVEE